MATARFNNGIDALTGRVGGVVYSNEQDGVGVRNHNPISKQPFTAAQLQIEANFTKATKAWVTLAPATAAQWKTYALGQKVKNPVSGKYRSRNARQIFVGLYAKMLQVSAASGLPSIPTGTYAGDSLTLTAVPSTGKITVTSSAANSANTTTEFLAYRLPSPNAIVDKGSLRTVQFFSFAPSTLSTQINVSAGTWVLCARYVNKTTGQETNLMDLPLQTVTLSIEEGGDGTTGFEYEQAA